MQVFKLFSAFYVEYYTYIFHLWFMILSSFNNTYNFKYLSNKLSCSSDFQVDIKDTIQYRSNALKIPSNAIQT